MDAKKPAILLGRHLKALMLKKPAYVLPGSLIIDKHKNIVRWHFCESISNFQNRGGTLHAAAIKLVYHLNLRNFNLSYDNPVDRPGNNITDNRS